MWHLVSNPPWVPPKWCYPLTHPITGCQLCSFVQVLQIGPRLEFDFQHCHRLSVGLNCNSRIQARTLSPSKKSYKNFEQLLLLIPHQKPFHSLFWYLTNSSTKWGIISNSTIFSVSSLLLSFYHKKLTNNCLVLIIGCMKIYWSFMFQMLAIKSCQNWNRYSYHSSQMM